MFQRSLLLTPIMLLSFAAHGQERSTDPLGPLTQCVNRDGFHYEKRDRLLATATARNVPTSRGTLSVSTADGYRLMVYRRSSAPLVNLKLERSAQGRFAEDRLAITAQMQDLGTSLKPSRQVTLESSTRQGIEVLALNTPADDQANGVISMYTLFDAASGTVATAYLLNQRKEVREYASEAEYAGLREQFIGVLLDCLAAPLAGTAQP